MAMANAAACSRGERAFKAIKIAAQICYIECLGTCRVPRGQNDSADDFIAVIRAALSS